MSSIRITVSRGGYRTTGQDSSSVVDPDVIEIDVPVPDRVEAFATNFIRPAEYVQLIGATFDKTAELVQVVRGELVDAEVVDDEVPG